MSPGSTQTPTREKPAGQPDQRGPGPQQRSLGAVIALGVLEILMGALAVILPFISGPFLILLIGAVITATGVLQLLDASHGQGQWGKWTLGTLITLAGVLIVIVPSFRQAFLTLLLAVYFLASGGARTAAYLEFKEMQGANALLLGAIVGFSLGVLVVSGLMGSGVIAAGFLVGANILTAGILTVMFAARTRRLVL